MSEMSEELKEMSSVMEESVGAEEESTWVDSGKESGEEKEEGTAEIKDEGSEPEPKPEPKDVEPKPEPKDKEATSVDAGKEPEDPLRSIKEENERLRSRIEELLTKKEPPTEEKDVKKPTFDLLTEVDLIGDEDLDDLIRDPSKFKKFVNSLIKTTVDISRADNIQTEERILRAIPETVKSNLALSLTLKEVSDRFYTDNPDLAPFKRVVGLVFEELSSKNPDKQLVDMLKDVETEARSRLELHREAIGKDKVADNADKDKSILARVKGSRKGKDVRPDTDSFLQEIDEMNRALI